MASARPRVSSLTRRTRRAHLACWVATGGSGCNSEMEMSGSPPPLPPGVVVRRSGAGVDCDTTCLWAGETCSPNHFLHVNRCAPTRLSSISMLPQLCQIRLGFSLMWPGEHHLAISVPSPRESLNPCLAVAARSSTATVRRHRELEQTSDFNFRPHSRGILPVPCWRALKEATDAAT